MAVEIQTSKIQIFKTCLTPARNALVDNLEGYLNTLVGTSNETYSNDAFQYLQMEKDMDIKINMTQAKVIDQSLGNYVKITESGKTWYYFLLKTTWKSRECVELKLSIDSINTFRNDLTFSDKTQIKRQSMPQFGLANQGIDPNKIIKSIDQIEIGKQYWFIGPSSSSSSEVGRLQTTGNNIIFRRMPSDLSTIYEETYVGKVVVNPSNATLAVYKWLRDDTYLLHKSITWTNYNQPDTEADLKGLWTIEFKTANTSTDNVNTVLETLGGEIIPGKPKIYTRLIDKYPEQLSVQQERILGPKIEDNNNGTTGLDWYLIYKTRNLPTEGDLSNPIDCFCIANQPLVVSKSGGGASKTLTPTDLPTGQYNYVLSSDNPGFSFSALGDITSDAKAIRTLTTGDEFYVAVQTYTLQPNGSYPSGFDIIVYKLDDLQFVSTGENIIVSLYGTFLRKEEHQGSILNNYYDLSAKHKFVVKTLSDNQPFNFNGNLKILELNFTRVTTDGNVPIQYAQTIINDTMVYNIGSEVTRSTIALSAIDRTDSKLIKIIKLPYAPIEITYSDGIYSFPSNWTYQSGLMKLNDAALATEFSNTINELTGDDLPIFWNPHRNISPTEQRSWYYENKIYHSDFYTCKVVYDSFVKTFKLENFDFSDFIPNDTFQPNHYQIPITFKPTNTVNSKFAFNFDMEAYGDFLGIEYKSQQDFEEYLLVDRNNEETIFSNAYIDYIRNGYNYDKKAKQQQETVSGILAGLQLAAGVASFAVSGITGNGFSAAAGIALVSGALSSFVSLANNRVQNENTMQSKLANLKAQSTNVAGADDVDLMSYYCGNRLRQISYRAITQDAQFLGDFFHFCGYNHPVIEKPKLTTRYWFNFIQCTPVFKEEGQTVYNDYVDDVKSRYEAGVTVYHYHAGIGDQDGWDWKQEYQNWDSWMLE